MAGDWIKLRCDLLTHPKVVRILSAIRLQDVHQHTDKFRVIGGLHAVWTVFDQHSEDGKLIGYTPEMMDHVIGWDGFCASMMLVDWLQFDGAETLVMPEFSEHNGTSGKRRAEDQKRKRESRKTVRTECGQNADRMRTREEKRREDSKSICPSPDGDRPPQCPQAQIVDLYHEHCPSLPRVVKLTPARRQQIRARWQNELPTLDLWADYFRSVEASDFLSGRTPPTGGRSRAWQADIDFLIKQSSVIKWAEGKYDD